MAKKEPKAKVQGGPQSLSAGVGKDRSATSDSLLNLAKKIFGVLKPVDEKFFKDVADGRPANFSDGVTERDDPAKANEWESKRVLAADRIVWLCQNSAALSKISGFGIQIVGARIEGDIKLQCSATHFPLVFKKCALSGNVDLGGSDIYLMDFSGSHVRSIDCTASMIDQGIFLCDGFRSNGTICLEYATTKGRVDCSGGQFINSGGDALDADGIEVRGDVLLDNGFKAEGMVSLVGANIGGNLECNQGVFSNAGSVAINAERLKVGGDVFLCKGSWGKSSKVRAEGFIANGEVKLGRAEIGGTLECTGGLFNNSGSPQPAINAKGLVVTGDVLFHDGFKAQGEVDLVGAGIEGNLECNKGVFTNYYGGVALDAERASINGDVFLCEESWSEDGHCSAEGFKAIGEVKLVRAVIGGDLNCIGGIFRYASGVDSIANGIETKYSINARGLKITGSVLLSEGFSSKGKVDLAGALVGGNFEFNSGEFINKGEVALDAERAKITGDVFLCEGRWRRSKPIEVGCFRIEGNINLIGVEVGGTVKFTGASFVNTSASTISSDISLLGARIKREFIWKQVESPKQVILDLQMARIGRLSLSSDSWLEPGNLRLNGLIYDQLEMENAPKLHSEKARAWRDIDAMIEWLKLQGKQFHYQPYEQLVASLRKQGRDKDAKVVLVTKARDRANLTKMAFVEKWWHKFLGVTIGYGYLPWRALLISIGVIVFGTLTFWIGYDREIIKATKLVEYVEYVVTGDTTFPREGDPNTPRVLSVREDYPNFNPLVYSLDMFVPLVDLRQATYWLPSPYEGEKEMPLEVRILRFYMWLHILAGWVFTSLLVVGLSGLVKR
jgi:hypothetical protein